MVRSFEGEYGANYTNGDGRCRTVLNFFSKKKGSSLVEMLMAIVVLGMVLISMVGMFLISRTAVFNKEDETANALALRFIEDIEGWPFEEFYADTPPFVLSSDQFSNKYNVTATVMGLDKSAAGKVYSAKVTVTVSWEAAALGSRSLELERVISSGGHKNVGQLQ
jgi:hypothetical protein